MINLATRAFGIRNFRLWTSAWRLNVWIFLNDAEWRTIPAARSQWRSSSHATARGSPRTRSSSTSQSRWEIMIDQEYWFCKLIINLSIEVNWTLGLSLNNQVVFYKRLHKIFFVDAIPKAPSGKILRKDLRAKLAAGIPACWWNWHELACLRYPAIVWFLFWSYLKRYSEM